MRRRFTAVLTAAILTCGTFGATAQGASAPDRPHYTNNVGFDDQAKATGFNLWDTGPDKSEVDGLPAGHRALVWSGGSTGDYGSCTTDMTFTKFKAAVDQLTGSDKVFGYYLWDEPDLERCDGSDPGRPNLLNELKQRAAYVKSATGGRQKTFVASGGGDGESAPAELAPAKSGIDYLGLDPYPCQVGKACDYSLIAKAVQGSLANGIPAEVLVPTYQAFGQEGSCIGKWRLPTPAETQQIFAEWDRLLPDAPFDVAYTWGEQDEYACQALGSDTAASQRLREVYKSRFTG